MIRKNEEPVYLSPKETEAIDRIAAEWSLTRDEVLTKLFKEGLARRMKKRVGITASPNVLKFRR